MDYETIVFKMKVARLMQRMAARVKNPIAQREWKAARFKLFLEVAEKIQW